MNIVLWMDSNRVQKMEVIFDFVVVISSRFLI